MWFNLEKKAMLWQLKSLKRRITNKVESINHETQNGKLSLDLKERLTHRKAELNERLLEIEYLIKKITKKIEV